jgi:hypothetical protein
MIEQSNDDTDSFNVQPHPTFSLPIIFSDIQLLNVYDQRTGAVLLRSVATATEGLHGSIGVLTKLRHEINELVSRLDGQVGEPQDHF